MYVSIFSMVLWRLVSGFWKDSSSSWHWFRGRWTANACSQASGMCFHPVHQYIPISCWSQVLFIQPRILSCSLVTLSTSRSPIMSPLPIWGLKITNKCSPRYFREKGTEYRRLTTFKRQRLEGEAKLVVWRPLLEPWGSWSVDDWTQEPLLEHRLRDAGLLPSLLLWLPLQERCLGGKATRMHFWRKFSQIHSSISCHWQWRTTRDMKTDSLFMPVFPSEYKAIYSILQNPGRREVLVNGRQLITGWTVLEKTPMVSIPVPACLPNIFPLPCLLKLYFLISRLSS